MLIIDYQISSLLLHNESTIRGNINLDDVLTLQHSTGSPITIAMQVPSLLLDRDEPTSRDTLYLTFAIQRVPDSK